MKSTVQLMTALAEHNRVLYVDYPFSLKDLALTALGRQQAPVGRMIGASPRLRTLTPKPGVEVHVLTPPPVLPVNGLPEGSLHTGLLTVNARIVERSIRDAMAHLGMQTPIVINAFNPYLGLPLVDRLGEQMRVYYCYDEISAAGWNSKHGTGLEAALIARSDVVITTSRPLQESRSALNAACHVVENGVDFELFHEAYAHWPEDNRPRVGFIGSLDARVDFRLLETVCAAAPDIEFVFVGRILEEAACRKLERLDNVTFLGPKRPEELPDVLAGFHVGIIPFVRDEFTRNIYPLKINEYLAAGRPVVMTDFAQLDEFAGMVSKADGPEAFLAALRAELMMDTASRRAERARLAEANAWPARAQRFGEILESYLTLPVEA